MFSHKLLAGLTKLLALLLMVKALVILAMFVWSFVGEQPLMVFNPAAPLQNNIFLLAQELGVIIFFYVLVGGVNHLVSCCGDACMPEKSEHKMSATRRTSSKKMS